MLTHQRSQRSDPGFSLVEVVVAMMLFAFLAVAILPLLFGVTRLTAQNSSSVSAKSVMQQKIAAIQLSYPSDPTVVVDSRPAGQTRDCAALAVASPPYVAVGDGLSVRTKAGPCPTVYPGTVPVQVTVKNSKGAVLAQTFTSVRVTQ